MARVAGADQLGIVMGCLISAVDRFCCVRCASPWVDSADTTSVDSEMAE